MVVVVAAARVRELEVGGRGWRGRELVVVAAEAALVVERRRAAAAAAASAASASAQTQRARPRASSELVTVAIRNRRGQRIWSARDGSESDGP